MAKHCVNSGHDFNLAGTKIFSHVNSWPTKLLKETAKKPSNKKSINKCEGLPQASSFCERKSADGQS